MIFDHVCCIEASEHISVSKQLALIKTRFHNNLGWVLGGEDDVSAPRASAAIICDNDGVPAGPLCAE